MAIYKIPYKISIIAISLFIITLLNGCKDKKEESSTSKRESNITHHKVIRDKNSFLIEDIDGRKTNIRFNEGRVKVDRVLQPIVMFYIFTPWCVPCRGELPYLSMLQRVHRDNLFIIGIITKAKMTNPQLRGFMKAYGATFFISNSSDNDKIISKFIKDLSLPSNYSIPLTLIYDRGRLYQEIEGATPYEMLDKMIKDINKEIK